MFANPDGINTIQELAGQGQSLWLDNLFRDMISSGELARLRDAGVTGITSLPDGGLHGPARQAPGKARQD